MKRLAILIALLGLAGCGGDEHQDLKQWMKDATKGLKGKVPPLPEIKSYPPVAYEAGDLVDPFRPSKLEPERRPGGGALQPDLSRRKEPLEAYPLESLKMVGAILKSKNAHALVQADKAVYQVRVGNYMGQNFGVITGITETEITLREMVADSLGDYSERTSVLRLQEKPEQESKR